jgi:ABC-type lipoprotein export system ATPase subunit
MSRLKNKAVVIATHDEALASKTDKLFHLKDGILI